ncbi:MAG TPA: chemotaxis protein CheW [Kofleriaceae bacterium]|nr:chemotaxis protein CheW [Kofleriaceae bacterium]
MTALHVSFRVGDAEYVVPADQVLHLESYDGATPIPGAPPYVAGLVQVRSRLVPVVDLRTRFGLPAVPRALDHRVIVVQLGNRIAGLLVDSAREVVRLADDQFQEPPEMIDRQADGFVKAVATVAKRMFLLVDIARVIREEPTHA